jgi:uncharacterized SAM-binding protein YcdF (DUF218 family)
VAWFFATPSNLLVALIALGLLLALVPRLRRIGLAAASLFTFLTLVMGLSPLSSLILRPLELRFPLLRHDGGPIEGIILLGGAVEADDSAALGQLVASDSAERVLATVALARRHPDVPIVISGGSATVFASGTAEAPVTARYFKEVGIDPRRLIVEDRSRTTAENAVFTKALLGQEPGRRWLLVTSAWHMPRAVGAFRQAGFPVVAYPVDSRTGGGAGAWRWFASVSEGLRRLDVGVKEWVGLLAYRWTGRTSEFFPGPPRDTECCRAAP